MSKINRVSEHGEDLSRSPKTLAEILKDDLGDPNPLAFLTSTETKPAEGISLGSDQSAAELELSDREQQDLDAVLAQSYKVEVTSRIRKSGAIETRGIVRGFKTKVANLRPNAWNPNTMSDRVQQALGGSLHSFGQLIEIVVRPHPEHPDKYEIIDGEHRFKSLSDNAVVNILYGYSIAELQTITVALNEDRGEPDRIKLGALLQNVQIDEDFDSLGETLPYDPAELQNLIAFADLDVEELDRDREPAPEREPEDPHSGWVEVNALVPREVYDRFVDAIQLVRSELQSGDLHQKPNVRNGQVLEILIAEYLASAH